MKGWRPSEWGEDPPNGHHVSYDTVSNKCFFPGCVRPRCRSGHRNKKGVAKKHRYCAAHMKQKQRNGVDGMKPINELMSAANKAAYAKRMKVRNAR